MSAKPTAISFPKRPVLVPVAPIDVTEFGRRRALIVAGVMLAALLQTLDATIVNVALPTIEGNIGAAIDDGTWIITGYIISNVIAIPLVPYMLQRFGRRQYYATCIIGFTVASFFCGTAQTLVQMILYRVIQGAFGGGLIATSQIILRDTFGPKKIGTSSALFAMALTIGPALGPTVGGILTDQFSWPWVFDINLVPGAIAAIVVLTTIRNPTAPRKMSLDVLGVALLATALGSMQYVLDEGERNDWFGDDRIVFFTATFVLGMAAFIIWELYGTTSPIVDLRVFRYRNVRFGGPAAIVLGIIIFGPTVMMPQYVQGVLGFTATLSGLLIFMRAVPVLVMTPIVARLATAFDFRFVLVSGFVLSAAGFAAIATSMTTQSDFGTFTAFLIFSGFGQSMLLVPLLVGMLSTIPPEDAPKASSIASLCVQLGGSIASTMLVTIFDRRTFFHSDILRGSVTQSRVPVQIAASHHGTIAELARLVRQQAVNGGFADAIYALVPMAGVGVLVALGLSRPKIKLTGPIEISE